MTNKREFDIPFVGLKPGIHLYEYKVDDKFFADVADIDFENCNANVKLYLDRHQTFLQLKFEVGGKADVVCDRCGNNLQKELWDEFNIVVKMVTNADEMNIQEEDPDIYYINFNESHINVYDWLYEFVTLSIPVQKICKEEERGSKLCNKEVLDKLQKMEEEINKSASNNVWKDLEKFKNNN